MKLGLPSELALGYNSPSQQARVVTQAWAHDNLFCVNCSSLKLTATREGTEANDLTCPQCSLRYELKSKSAPIISKIMDAGYEAMMRAIRADRTPNLVLLHYQKPQWTVRNLFLVPHFAFAESSIEKRNPLRDTAERHGHVLCNILRPQLASLLDVFQQGILNGKKHPPAIIDRFLFALLSIGALLSGYSMAIKKEEDWFLTVLYLGMMWFALHVIFALEFPHQLQDPHLMNADFLKLQKVWQ